MGYGNYDWYSTENLNGFEMQYESWVPGFEDLLAITHGEDMKPLGYDDIEQHVLGVGIMGITPINRGTVEAVPLSYAAITGLDTWDGEVRAVIGGFLVHPEYRNHGLGMKTMKHILEIARSDQIQTQLGHDGLIAKCNSKSWGIFNKLGFVVAEEVAGKHIIVAPLVQ